MLCLYCVVLFIFGVVVATFCDIVVVVCGRGEGASVIVLLLFVVEERGRL